MRKSLAIAVLAAAAVLLPSVALAAPKTWPTGCKANSYDDKQAVKGFRDVDLEGIVEAECGSFWAPMNGASAVADPHMGQSDGGGFDNANDNVSSLVIFNRAQYGACFVFYIAAGYPQTNRMHSVWIAANPTGAKYRWKATDSLPGNFLSNGPNDAISSVHAGNAWASPFYGISTSTECDAFDDAQHWDDAPLWYSGIEY